MERRVGKIGGGTEADEALCGAGVLLG